jgi:isopentenyl-diphosphate delta-isomerase type 1
MINPSTTVENEILDIVDNNDQVIGNRSRFEIHRDGNLHRAVHILVFNRQNQLFLQKRSLLKDINAGLWDSSAAGHVDSGEDYDQCAVRELAEELGIIANKDLNYLFKMDATAATGMEFIRVYRIIYDGPLTLSPKEIDDGLWLEPTIITVRVTDDDPELTETFKWLWRKFIGENSF